MSTYKGIPYREQGEKSMAVEMSTDMWVTRVVVRTILGLALITAASCTGNNLMEHVAQERLEARRNTPEAVERVKAEAARAHEESMREMWAHSK